MAVEEKGSVESLLESEASLDRGFAMLVVAVLAVLGWLVCRIALRLFDSTGAGLLSTILLVGMMGAYAWFAIVCGRAASEK